MSASIFRAFESDTYPLPVKFPLVPNKDLRFCDIVEVLTGAGGEMYVGMGIVI